MNEAPEYKNDKVMQPRSLEKTVARQTEDSYAVNPKGSKGYKKSDRDDY